MYSAGKFRRRLVYVLGCMCLLAAAGWVLLRISPDSKELAKRPIRTDSRPEMSGWLADWQWEAGVQDLRRTAAGLSSLQVFAAYFDESDHLKFTSDFREAWPIVREQTALGGVKRVDLTIVNDILHADGSDSEKDPSLIGRLTADSASRSRHIDEIEEAVRTYGFDGVELDYEKIPASDWDGVIRLISELYGRLKPQGKSLRVVLEPEAPFDRHKLPSGPTYVVMAYNLYGGFSGPGPKADLSFIRKLAAKMDSLPGRPYLALSAGGFDWPEPSGQVGSLTEEQAEALVPQSDAPPVRDSKSGSLHFQYTDASGTKHTVWYADEQTLSLWAKTARNLGLSNVAIWRLGGLGEASLDWIKSFRASS